jgi:molybdopterin molybdotransferase
VLSTGNELVPPEKEAVPGQIPDSNRPALLGVLRELGFPTLDLGLAGDDAAELTDRILAGVGSGINFLLTSGGVSVGDHDLTRTVLGSIGNVESYQVAVKPGKPQLFGEVQGVPVFGLPGNPVSSLVVFDQFVLPALKKRGGRRDLIPPQFRAILGARVVRRPGRVEFLRVALETREGVWVATSTGPQGSGVLPSMTRARGYAILSEDVETLEAGAEVLCQFRGWGF